MARLNFVILMLVVLCLSVFTVDARSRRRGRHHHRHRSHSHVGQVRRHMSGINLPQADGAGFLENTHRRANQLWGTAENHFPWFESDAHNPFLSFFVSPRREHNRSQKWWLGPNICEKKTEDMQNNTKQNEADIMVHFSKTIQQCDYSESAYKCRIIEENVEGRREVTIIYECCHGHSRERGDFGCPKKLKMKNLVGVAKDLNLTEFMDAVGMLELTKMLDTNNLTVFAPVNGAFGLDSNIAKLDSTLVRYTNSEYQMDAPAMDSQDVFEVTESEMDRTIETLRHAILGHVVKGARRSSSLNDEEVIETGNPEGSTIRINYFTRPAKLMTANCVPVVSRDNLAKNGVIHTVNTALIPVTENLLEIVKTRPDLSILKKVLSAANYVPKLEEDGKFTLLAPTNGAFEKMNRRLMERLLNGDQKCVEKLLMNHMLPNVICSAAFQKRSRTANLLDKYVQVVRNDDDKLFVNDAQVVSKDIMGLNGVLHIVDSVLVPEEALDLLDVLERKGLNELITLIEVAGLTDTLASANNVTVFAPTNEAIKQLPLGLKSRLMSDKDLLKKVLTYHISPSTVNTLHFHNNQLLPSLEGRQVRLNRFSFNPFSMGERTVQCAPIDDQVIKTCNGQVDFISKVMLPPVGSIIDVLASDKRFSTFIKYLKQADLVNILQQNGPFTIFAPNNEAFKKIDQRTLDNLMRAPGQIARWMKMHIIRGTLCCAGITRSSWLRMYGGEHYKALSGHEHRVTLNHHGKPSVSRTPIVKCDRTGTNGNVHEIEDVLTTRFMFKRWRSPPTLKRMWRNGRRMLSP